MDAERQLDKICKQIENDPNLTDDEKNEAIKEEELAFGEYLHQYDMECEALDRQYGF